MKLNNQLRLISEACTLADADSVLCKILGDLGCEKFSYNNYAKDYHLTRKVRHVVCSRQAQDWQNYYCANHYDQIDPILNRMRKSHLPLSWTLEKAFDKQDKKQKSLYLDALSFGLRGGFAVPIHAPFGEFANLVIQEALMLKELEQYPEMKHQLQLIAYHYHARISNFLETDEKMEFAFSLTPREMECLQLTGQQKSAKEIAKILNLSPRTIGFHLENVIKKLGVKNKYQAIIKAQKYLFIS